MSRKVFILMFVCLVLAATALAQRQPPRPGSTGGPPGMGTPRPDGPPNGPPRNQGPGDWIRPHDANGNGSLEPEEFAAAAERTFAEFDKNGNGTIEAAEAVRPPKGMRPQGPPPQGHRPEGPPPQGMRPNERPPQHGGDKRVLPPFFFLDRMQGDQLLTRAQFDAMVRGVFSEMDGNGDGTLNPAELRRMPKLPGQPSGPPPMTPTPNGRFVGAEMRFGDQLIKGQPFSAETVIEDTKMLFNGTLVKKETRGNIYRDSGGRTRREQTLGPVANVNIIGAEKLVFINDFAAGTQYVLDASSKIAHKNRFNDHRPPPLMVFNQKEPNATSEGTKTIDGVVCNLTRTEYEIPAGQFGNDKPMKGFTERCFSTELQMVIMSLHQDPVQGVHSFKLEHIRRAEPGADLFTVPSGYRIVVPPTPRPDEDE